MKTEKERTSVPSAVLRQSHFFALLSRMKYINRWGLMRNNRSENVAEHSLQVAMFAQGLAVIKNVKFGGKIDPAKVAQAALYHDAGEIITGDLPTPVKYYNPYIKNEYKKIEQIADEKLLALLPEELRPAFVEAFHPEKEILQIVKAADKLSAYFKCMEELGAGNLEFQSAAEATKKALSEMDMPEVNFFLDCFGGSFHLTLDQLQAGE